MSFPKMFLRPAGIHVWLTDTCIPLDSGLIDQYRNIISKEELKKADRYLAEKDRRSSLVTRALVRYVLSRYADVSPSAWRFVTNAHGRPSIAPGMCGADLVFNLSHTDGLVACAVTLSDPVGVDVERSDRLISMDVAQRFFAPEEVGVLSNLDHGERQQRSLDFWTLKEAYIKARGMGMAIPLNHFWFHMEGGSVRICFSPELTDRSEKWRFFRHDYNGTHKIAVAVQNPCVPSGSVQFIPCVPKF